MTEAVWHPNGIFILTVHEDTSLVLWDSKDGRKLQARTLHATNVDQPGGSRPAGPDGETTGPKEPIIKVAWCAKESPDDTGLLVAGGRHVGDPNKGLTFLDMGPTPNYQTSSWQVLSSYFEEHAVTFPCRFPQVHMLSTSASFLVLLLILRALTIQLLCLPYFLRESWSR